MASSVVTPCLKHAALSIATTTAALEAVNAQMAVLKIKLNTYPIYKPDRSQCEARRLKENAAIASDLIKQIKLFETLTKSNSEDLERSNIWIAPGRVLIASFEPRNGWIKISDGAQFDVVEESWVNYTRSISYAHCVSAVDTSEIVSSDTLRIMAIATNPVEDP